MEYICLMAVLLVIMVIFFARMSAEEKKRARLFEEKLRKEYGHRPPKTYPGGRLEAVKRHYNRDLEDAFSLDEITLGDLDFESLFKRIDRTHSAAGEEGLYRMLRVPCFDPGELARRKELILYFREHEDERVRLQLYFASVGRTDRYSVYDYLDRCLALEKKSNAPHYLLILLMLISLGIMFLNPTAGVLMLIMCIVYNFTVYFRQMRVIEPYISTFGYFLRILDMAEELERCRIDKIDFLIKRIGENRKRFAGFARFSSFLTKTNAMSSDPLEIVMDYLRMGLHLNIIKFYLMLEQIQKNSDAIAAIMADMGYLEALITAGEFAESMPHFAWADLTQAPEKISLVAKKLYHPLLDEPVSNDVELAGSMLLTGSNASGKSTFLKTVAIAQLMAQSFGFVCAEEYGSCYYRLFTSMAIRDDLGGGRSYYIVEIESLKRILDAAARGTGDPKGCAVMCFVDEVLRGTNTVERISAGAQILESLVQKGVFSFAATHDIELTDLLSASYANYHFEESVEDGDVRFNYRLQSGKAQSRNAIRLLSLMGYSEEITGQALKRAEHFIETGDWI